MSRSSVRYEPVPQPHSGDLDDIDEEGGEDDIDATELQPLAPSGSGENLPPLTSRSLFGGLFSKPQTSPSDRPSPLYHAPSTPVSSDGVFMNIPAKPSSSRDHHKDEELGPDEWIFMTPEQRKKLKPPKYSRIKRDRAPRYTTEYTPPQLPPSPGPRKKKRDAVLKPRVNSLPVGSSAAFFATVFLCTALPFLGCLFTYIASRGRWKTHASKLGARTGTGLGIIHVGAMLVYIPALLPGIFTASSVPLIAFLLWTMLVGLPLGWRVSIRAAREFKWVQTQERVLCANLGLAAVPPSTADDDEEDVEGGYTYIEGTDIRVRDLRKILARARDARLARSLRAAGF